MREICRLALLAMEISKFFRNHSARVVERTYLANLDLIVCSGRTENEKKSERKRKREGVHNYGPGSHLFLR